MNLRHLLRMARLARHPPGRRQRITVAVVLGAAALIWGIEALVGWPDWATLDRTRLSVPPR